MRFESFSLASATYALLLGSTATLVGARPSAHHVHRASAGAAASNQTISQSLYDEFVYHFKYASSAYYPGNCPNPNGNVLITYLTGKTTGVRGYIVRDDNRQELVVAYQGTNGWKDELTDVDAVLMSPYLLSNAKAPFGVLVHHGVQSQVLEVEAAVLSNLTAQLKTYPTYTIVSVGHSLGAAVASLSATQLRQAFPKNLVQMYTYGQLRTGNGAWANWVDSTFGQNVYRITHTNDGVPTLYPRLTGWTHHSTEYWQSTDPVSLADIKICSGNEDPTCCDQYSPSQGVNNAHLTYMGIPFSTKFCT